MSRFTDTFSREHVVLPVIHVESLGQAERNAAIAYEAGCDGIFLINHGLSVFKLLEIHYIVASNFRNWWVGVNCLGLRPEDVFAKAANTKRVAGIWTDSMGIDEHAESQTEAEAALVARESSGWNGLYFGGVAFKYQREVADLERVARIAARYTDVVTTSGPGTGEAASREKIVRLKGALGDTPLAIASGITPENVGDYLDVADCFLVATGISKSWSEIDFDRTCQLVDAVRPEARPKSGGATDSALGSSLTQEFVFETDSLEALEQMLRSIVPVLFGADARAAKFFVSEGDEKWEPDSYPSRAAAHYLRGRDPKETKIHAYVCSISADRWDTSPGRRFPTADEAVRAVVELAPRKARVGLDRQLPFEGTDGSVGPGYRVQWYSNGSSLHVFRCNILYMK